MTFAKFRLPASRRVTPRLLLLLAGGLLLLALWGLQFNPYLNPADDSGRYMVLGESVARSGGLRLLNDPKHQLDTLYPPGFPLLIAFWIRLMGRDPGGVVSLVKATNIALLLFALPLLYALLKHAKLSRVWLIVGVLAFALCPTVAHIGNEVMAEAPFLVLCLASVVLAERGLKGEGKTRQEDRRQKTEEEGQTKTEERTPMEATPGEETPRRSFFPSSGLPVFPASLLCAGAAFLVRTAGISLLLAQIVWFFKRFGWRWGVAALLVAGIVVGGWQTRNRRIAFYHPTVHYDSYVDQFTMRDPSRLGAGRIAMSPAGLAERASTGIPNYIGMIPRVLLTMMAPPRSFWLGWFYLLAVPITLLILLGFAVAWRRKLYLVCGFSALFWLFAAMWPWVNPRFLLPLLPYLILFLLLGASRVSARITTLANRELARGLAGAFAVLLLLYWARVHVILIGEEGKRTLPNYTLGRTPSEGGFYAACAFLKTQGTEREVVMGRPQYLLHLYSGHVTRQIEPVAPKHAQMEEVYVKQGKVTWLLEDQWSWSHSDKYLGAYLRQFAPRWNLAWQDPQGSGVRVWRRALPIPISR